MYIIRFISRFKKKGSSVKIKIDSLSQKLKVNILMSNII